MRSSADSCIHSAVAMVLIAFVGCSDSSDSGDDRPSGISSGGNGGSGGSGGSGNASGVGATGGASAGSGGAAVGGAGGLGGSSAGTGGSDPSGGSGGSGTGAVGGSAGVGGGAGVAGSGGTGPVGPVDGDPSKPRVSIPGVPCGVPTVSYGTLPPTVKIGGRDVVVTYPCAHEGAQVTFLFVLHGTLQDAQKIPFTMTSGPFYRLTDSHNIIYVLPKAITTQWGNGDNGQDLPHLYEVVDWVYATFGEKFNIRSMWAQGGSWGARYLSTTFACDARFENRLRGVRMVVGGGCPRCSDRLSCIVAQQELELGGGSPMTPDAREAAADRASISQYATAHGCDMKTGPTDVGNTKHWSWPNCDPGWVHSYYMAPDSHASPWDPVAIEKTAGEMKSIE